MYARWLPWEENNVAVTQDKILLIQVDGNLDARSFRIVNNTTGTIYYQPDSTAVDRTNNEAVIRSNGAVLNFPKSVSMLALLPDQTGFIDVQISDETLPDIFQAQELTHWSETQFEQPTLLFGTTQVPASPQLQALGDWAGIEVVYAFDLADVQFNIEWYANANDVALGRSPLISDSWDMSVSSLSGGGGNQAAGGRFRHFFVGRAPFFRFDLLAFNAGTQHFLQYVLSNRMFRTQDTDENNELVAWQTNSLGAGVTKQLFLMPYSGPCQFDFRTQAAANSFAIYGYDSNGTQHDELYLNTNIAAGQTISPVLYLPRRIIRVDAINNDGVSRVFRVTAVPISQ